MARRPLPHWAGRILVALGLMVCLLVPAAAAGAQESEPDYPITTTTDPSTTTTTVGGTIVTRPRSDPGSLPFTGGDTALLVALGLGAALGGFALVWFGRRADTRS